MVLILDALCQFVEDLPTYAIDLTIMNYLQILDLDIELLSEENFSIRKYEEINKMIECFYLKPNIFREIILRLSGKQSKLDFLIEYSAEQIKYITNTDIGNAKLIACAGSGKTRSIIGRIKFLVDHGYVKKENIFMITFSKHAALDFQKKVQELFPDYAKFCQLQNFSTIDSLAKSVLCRVKSHKSENVEILSVAFRNYLKNLTLAEIETLKKMKDIRYLFVDEAQDLNEIQYDIVMLLRDKLGTISELIGDPNQNIYQFRRSNSAYLLNFPAKKYELTQNFRSSQQIINFAESIKPVQTTLSKSAYNKIGPPIVIISKSSTEVHKFILEYINNYSKEKDLSNIAVICPTRGIKSFDTIGLSVFFNFFRLNNIPINQLYDESGIISERKKTVGKISGHINLLTYHGTKGLEFDVVFVMDFYHHLFNIKPAEDEHRIYQYLLYVACSRAINQMFICTYTNMHGGYLNHWITKVPRDYYLTERYPLIPKLEYRKDDAKVQINGITALISELTDTQLNMIHDMIKITHHKDITDRIYKDFTDIDRGKDEALFGTFCEQLIYLQYYLSLKMTPRKMPLIEKILKLNLIHISDEADYNFLKKYIYHNGFTWQKFDEIKNELPEHMVKLINTKFDRKMELTEYLVCTNEFIQVVQLNSDIIKEAYQYYLAPTKYNYDYRRILEDFFYLNVVIYAYEINHYHYICNKAFDKKYLLESGKELFKEMYLHFSVNYILCDLDIDVEDIYPKLELMGKIDFIEKFHNSKKETIVEVKCVKELSIKYYIQLLLYNFCHYWDRKSTKILYENDYKIINLLTGLEHRFNIKITQENMFNILSILSEVGGLKFKNLNLVYDLETTDMIKKQGPIIREPYGAFRTVCKKVQSKYYTTTYPEIIEIAIKDYDTEMIILNSMVKPSKQIHPDVVKLTGIRTESLKNEPNIDFIRGVLENKMKNFTCCKMMAHNGAGFDDKIMIYDKLVDLNKVGFLDTMSIIPIHLNSGDKLEGKSVVKIYEYLFKKGFVAHRAMEDVDALIKIMKYLQIKF